MEIVFLSLLTLVASFIGTVSGFGLSTVMLPILVLSTPLPTALLFVGIIHAFSDLWKVILFKHAFDNKIILMFGIPGILASFYGARIALTVPQQNLLQILGLIIISYVILITLRPKLTLPHNFFYSGIGGATSGLMAGIFGMGGAIRTMFLSAFNFPKDVYIFATGAIGLIIDSGRLFTYYLGGVRLEKELIYGLIIFIPVSFAGAKLAKKLLVKIPQKSFRNVVGASLLIIGVKLIIG